MFLIIISLGIFSLPNSVHIPRVNMLTAYIRASNSFILFLANSLMWSLYIRWLMFSCNLLNLLHFLSMWLGGVIAITNIIGDSASPWNIPLWIYTSARLFPPAVNSTLQISMVSSMDLIIWLDILCILSLLSSCYYYYYFAILRVFHTSVRWWFSIGVWETARFHKSPGHFSVFWPIVIMLLIGLTPLVF